MAGRVGGYKTPLEYDNRARSRRRRHRQTRQRRYSGWAATALCVCRDRQTARVCAFMPTPYMPTPHMPTNKISVRLCLRKQSECYYDSLSEITDDKFNTGYHNE